MRTAIFFDTETTGLSKRTDRLVQIAWLLVDLSDSSEMNRGSYLIKPDGFDIPYRATEKHGIDTNMALRRGQLLSEVLDLFYADISAADLLIGHNIPFDINMISAEFIRLKLSTEVLTKPSVCTMRLSTNWCRLPKFNGGHGFKWPTLQELHFKLFGENFDDAHDALADILATKKCFDALINLDVIVLPMTEFDFTSKLSSECKSSPNDQKQRERESSPDASTPTQQEFFKAIQDGDTELISRGITGGINVNKVYDEGWSPLQWAFWFNEIGSAITLIQNGANIAGRGKDGTTLLHICTNERLLPYLIKYLENIDARTLFGSTPLHHQCVMGVVDIIEVLLWHGASIHARCPDGEYVASRIVCGELYRPFALQRALNNNSHPKDLGATPLHFLVLGHGSTPDFEYNANLLVDAGLDVDSLDEFGRTPFMYGARYEYRERCDVLVNIGANAHAKDYQENNILHIMSQKDLDWYELNIDWLEDFIDINSFLNSENIEGLTPLQTLCMNSYISLKPKLIETFINAGADPYHKTSAGKSAWDIISQNTELESSEVFWKINQKRFI